MKLNSLYIIFILLCIPLSACGSSSITITVLDAETKKPIEGAVAIAFWNQTKGVPGMTRTETVKIVEAVSDKDGKFTIPAVSVSFFADKPHLKVYKPDYVGWYNKRIYKGYHGEDIFITKAERRINFRWQNQTIFLDKFKNEYSHNSHKSFLYIPLPSGNNLPEKGSTGLFRKSLLQEANRAASERQNFRNKKQQTPN